MKDKHLLRLVIAATILVTTKGTKDVLLSLLPALPLPDAKPTPEYNPATPVCQTITMNHTGFNATQEPGDVLLCQPTTTPTPTQPTNIVGTTTSRTVKTTTTTNTTTTEVRTITTTTTTTIEATTTSTNTTIPMDVRPCNVSDDSKGTQFNWWQILLENGGEPGMNGNKNADNSVSDSPPVNPCVRPLESQDNEKYAYKHEISDGKTYSRKEFGYRRFNGSPSEFLDVRGELIWIPPENAHNSTSYLVNYILDDTGFWVSVLVNRGTL